MISHLSYKQAGGSDRGADGGRVFTACNATPGTGIAQSIITAYSGTNAALALYLDNVASSDVVLVPQWIRLINTVVGTATTRSEGAIGLYSSDVEPSGGTALTARSSRLGGSASMATVRAGAVTLASAATIMSRFQLRTAIMVQYEEFFISFGEQGISPSRLMSGTDAQRNVIVVPPISFSGIGIDSYGMSLHLWNPGNAVTAPSWEVEVCWRELSA